ncbi:MAG: prolyl aminopeptidase [Alphaproteobacteria bacterium]
MSTTRLDVGDGHILYIEECGNPDGIPVIYIHGGPGSGISPLHRRFFDPSLFRVILFDQRGAGQSRPFAETEANTTWTLVDDLERIRQHFAIDRWLVFGGSWGSTLGLVYGITHPQSCLGFVLRGIFLGTKPEINWFMTQMGRFYPEAWDRFIHALPEHERDDPLFHYHKRLMDPSPSISIPAAESWSAYENSCATLHSELRGGGGRMAVSLARLEAHYFVHDCFLDEGYILDHVDRLHDLPAIIIQGRHDVICPPISASNLAKAWPNADLRLVDDAGHSALEPGILRGLMSALRQMPQLITF